MQITQRGRRYAIGEHSDYYGVWNMRAGRQIVGRFPRTLEGWHAAWDRYRSLEAEPGRRSRRGTPATIFHISMAMGIGALVALFTSLDSVVGGPGLERWMMPLVNSAMTAGAWLLGAFGRTSSDRRAAALLGFLAATVALLLRYLAHRPTI